MHAGVAGSVFIRRPMQAIRLYFLQLEINDGLGQRECGTGGLGYNNELVNPCQC